MYMPRFNADVQQQPQLRGRKQAMKKPSTSSRPNIYQTVTDRILSSLKAGVIPWEKPWQTPHFTGGPFPRNFRTGKPYRGINVFFALV